MEPPPAAAETLLVEWGDADRLSPPRLESQTAAQAEALSLYAQGLLEEIAGNRKKALAHYLRALELGRESDAPAQRAAMLLLHSGEPDKAISFLEDAVRRWPQSPELRLFLVQVYLTLDRPEQAQSLAEEACQLHPQDARAHYLLASLHISAEREQDAVAVLEAALDVVDDKLPLLRLVGDIYARRALASPESLLPMATRAIECYESAMALATDEDEKYECLQHLSGLYLLAGRKAEALRVLRALAALRPDDKELGEELMLWRRAMESDTDSVSEDLELLGPAMPETAEDDGAGMDEPDLLRLLRARPELYLYYLYGILAEQPDEPTSYLRLACLQADQGALEEALKTIGWAVENCRNAVNVWYLFALLHQQADDYVTACAGYARVEILAVGTHRAAELLDALFYFRFGSACEQAGDRQAAERLLWRAIELDSGMVMACNYLAYIWALQGENLAQALELVEHALEEEPENGAYLDTRGWIFYKQQRYEEALDSLISAIYFEPNEPVIFEHLGHVWVALGEEEQALACWRQSARLDPDGGAAKKLKQLGVAP